MANKLDISGEKLGRLTTVAFSHTSDAGLRIWTFQCDCGQVVEAAAKRVKNGQKRSCGCLSSDTTAARNRANAKHGQHRSPEYRSWMHMRSRCLNPNMHAYADYGGRGITVCERWDSFENFLADMGPRPEGHSIDRINNDLGYFPENCRWASKTQQSRNTRGNFIVAFRGREMPLSEAVALAGIADNVVRARLRWKWSVERALTEPVRPYISPQPQR